jgi:hypothetical protein
MPIRINLLAEAQAAEEARLHDPVKRGVWVGGFLIFLVGLYIFKLWVDVLISGNAFKQLEVRWSGVNGLSAKAGSVTNNQSRIILIDRRLAELDRLSTNRFYWGTFLNVLQQTVVDDVQLTSLRGTQEYSVTNAIPAKTADGQTTPRVPASSVERITITVEGKDWNYGQQTYDKYRQALSTHEYFSRLSGGRGFRLGNTLGSPLPDPLNPSRSFLMFTLECRFQEVARRE